ncbi:hypothetical protein AAFF_G00271100 [Aldrovandia affinis]|uniref:Uncharacterized protein n=1 Tax=Aldrovandia affinis TaxID=143900 RepID=A0AAD7RB60_9TELE|nr:hypothetical protein AAFF_G00271100 [Aldrovandia affinis]
MSDQCRHEDRCAGHGSPQSFLGVADERARWPRGSRGLWLAMEREGLRFASGDHEGLLFSSGRERVMMSWVPCHLCRPRAGWKMLEGSVATALVDLVRSWRPPLSNPEEVLSVFLSARPKRRCLQLQSDRQPISSLAPPHAPPT